MRHLPILIGMAGILALVFVVMIMLRVIHDTDIENAPPAGEQKSAPAPERPKELPLNR
jgi:hypothetical protein